MYVDEFGFIPQRLDLLWDRGQIRTLECFEEAVRWFDAHSNRDGYLYPPLIQWRSVGSEGESERLESTERPALLQRIPATHELRLRHSFTDQRTGRLSDAGFIVRFLGFLLGHRCQFADWWVDGRILARKHNDYHIFLPDIVSVCLERALNAWSTWPRRDQTVFTNALFLHNRAPGYEWDWERFQGEYQVLDALCSMACRRHGITTKGHVLRGHVPRIEALCNHFGLARNPDLVRQIVNLRNDLVHEALWGGQVPTSAPKGVFDLPFFIHHLNQRLGLAILGFTHDYMRTPWWSGSQKVFTVT